MRHCTVRSMRMPLWVNEEGEKAVNINKEGRITGKKSTPVEKILNICIVLAVCVLAIAIFSFVREYRSYDEGDFTEEHVINSLQSEEYAAIPELCYGHWIDNFSDPKKESINALARYIDAAFMRRAFLECGMEEKAAAQERRMEQNAAKLGMFAGERENIDRAVAEN